MRNLVTTMLDAVGLLAVAAGVGMVTAPWIGWGGLILAGAVVLGGVQLAERANTPGGER